MQYFMGQTGCIIGNVEVAYEPLFSEKKIT